MLADVQPFSWHRLKANNVEVGSLYLTLFYEWSDPVERVICKEEGIMRLWPTMGVANSGGQDESSSTGPP